MRRAEGAGDVPVRVHAQDNRGAKQAIRAGKDGAGENRHEGPGRIELS